MQYLASLTRPIVCGLHLGLSTHETCYQCRATRIRIGLEVKLSVGDTEYNGVRGARLVYVKFVSLGSGGGGARGKNLTEVTL